VKFIASVGARCLKIFSWEEVRPPHGITNTMMVAAATERFGFQFRPPPPVPSDAVLKFADGKTIIDGNLIPIVKFDVYSDGFASECTHTDDAKLVADEILRWAQSDLGFREFARPPKEIFQSQILVEFEPGFENLFKSWRSLQDLLNASAQKRYGFTQSVDVYRMEWRGDPHTIVNNTLVSSFWIERKAGEPHASNRWICTSPLPTDEWVELLGAIERLAVSG
jgi:hypothetical protein